MRLFLILGILWCTTILAQGKSCPHPSTEVNTRVEVISLTPGSVAKYSCDKGYELFGTSERTCSENGSWSNDIPMCATNVAWRKPANQSTTVRGGEPTNANDGDLTTVHDGNKCSQTLAEESPWWSVDLLREYEISLVRITTKGCCGGDKVQDIEIRIGDSETLQRNRLCTWYPGALEEGESKEIKCARKIRGRYVFIQMVGIRGSLSLCEVEVFSPQELSKDRCKGNLDENFLGLFNDTCYEFQATSGGSYEIGRAYCQRKRGGDLLFGVTPMAERFIMSELRRIESTLKTKLFWIGATKDEGFISRSWTWVNGEKVESPPWGKDQPNNYNGEQNCIVLDGGRDWLWNDIGCDLNYLHWICQFQPSCGSPNKNENTTYEIITKGTESFVDYKCPTGSKVMGDTNRTCMENGQWSGIPPTCLYIDCGEPQSISHGTLTLVDNRSTFSAKIAYECLENYTISGVDTLTCGDGGLWTPETPQCLYSWCPEMESPKHGVISMSGRRSGDTAEFMCEPGYNVIGDKAISCSLGGSWSGEVPSCRFIDCGMPENLQDGKMELINGTTYFDSIATYNCHEDYLLMGLSSRKCENDGFWTGERPYCKPINCGEPEVPVGGVVTGYDFDVHSTVEYECEKGHYLTGDQERVCTRSGEWSGSVPTCTFIDCGRLPVIVKGEIKYLSENGETFLGSEVEYSCAPNYKLDGEPKRICQRNGQWTGQQPICREIRCPQPEHPPKSRITLSGGDRRPTLAFTRQSSQMSPAETHRIGTQMSYRCDRGHVAIGARAIYCKKNGEWSHKAPTCKFVDCGIPKEISKGRFRLLSNETTFGAMAAYECNQNFRVRGDHRRQCSGNGTWGGPEPECAEVQCPSLSHQLERRYKAEDEKEIEPWKRDLIQRMKEKKELRVMVNDGDRVVGSKAIFYCSKGRTIIGDETMLCKQHGIWEGTEPSCKWVYCSQPADLVNGRVHLVSKNTKFEAVVEHFCLPNYKLIGGFNRTCTQNGTWSGIEPRCVLDDSDYGSYGDNSVLGASNFAVGVENNDPSYTGIYVGVIVSLLLILSIAAGIFVFKRKLDKTKPKSTSNIPPKENDVPNQTVLNYGDLNDPTTGNNIYEHIPDDFDPSYANMTPTSSFSSSPPGSYANYPRYEDDMTRRPIPISQRPRMPPPQPPQTHEPASVTINGVSVKTSVT